MRILIALGLYVLSCATAAQSSELHLELASIHYPPYHDQYLPNGGFVTEIVRQAFIKKNYTIDVDFSSLQRALDVAKFNFVDGVFMLNYSNEYDAIFYFSKPILYIKFNLLGLKNNPKLAAKYTDLTQLKDLTIAVGENNILPDILDKNSGNIQTAVDDKAAIWSLLAGKVDLVLLDEMLAQHLLAHNFAAKQQIMFFWPEQAIAEIAQYLAVAKQNPQAKKIIFSFNAGLDALKDSGEYAKIVALLDGYY
jgi:polar amino acid transport system substrate-binding protein